MENLCAVATHLDTTVTQSENREWSRAGCRELRAYREAQDAIDDAIDGIQADPRASSATHNAVKRFCRQHPRLAQWNRTHFQNPENAA